MKINKLYIEENISSSDLLKKALTEFGIEQYEIIKNEEGKPYIKGNPIYFNISNKDNITVLLISDLECGVDIETITFNEKIMNKFYLKSEIDLINNSLNKEQEFTKIWVKKESYIKMIGKGLSFGIKNIDTNNYKYEIKEYKNYYIASCFKMW